MYLISEKSDTLSISGLNRLVRSLTSSDKTLTVSGICLPTQNLKRAKRLRRAGLDFATNFEAETALQPQHPSMKRAVSEPGPRTVAHADWDLSSWCAAWLTGGRAASEERTISDNCLRISRTKRWTHVLTTGFVMMGNSDRRISWWLSELEVVAIERIDLPISKNLAVALPSSFTTSVLAHLEVLGDLHGKSKRKICTLICGFGIPYTSQLELYHLRTRMAF